MNSTKLKFLTEKLDKSATSLILEKLLPLLDEGIQVENEIPLPLTSWDAEKSESNINSLLKTIQDNGYKSIETTDKGVHEIYEGHLSSPTVIIDFKKARAFTGFMEWGIPLIIIIDIEGNRIMLYKNDIQGFQFRDDVRPIIISTES